MYIVEQSILKLFFLEDLKRNLILKYRDSYQLHTTILYHCDAT